MDTTTRKTYWRCLIPLLLFAAGLIFSQAGASTMEAASSDDRLAESREQVLFIRSEIKAVQEDLEWLSGKIKDLKAFDRFVPARMHESVAFKKAKIQSLKKLEARYGELYKRHQAEMTRKRAKGPTSALGKKLMQQITRLGLEDWVVIKPVKKGVRLENRLPILFSAASSDVPKGYDAFIRQISVLLKSNKATVIVSGYADTDPIRTEKYPSNFELGAARAGTVVRTFVKNGVDPSIFKVFSTGAHRAEDGLKTEWKSLQRHVDISVHFQEDN